MLGLSPRVYELKLVLALDQFGFNTSQISHVFQLNLLVLRFDHFEVILVSLSLLSEPLCEVFSLLGKFVNCMVSIVL